MSAGRIPDEARPVLACPSCGGSLEESDANVTCVECRSHYEFGRTGALDLRLQQKKSFVHEFELGAPPHPPPEFEFGPLPLKADPEVDFSGIGVPSHLTREILSHFPRAKNEHSLMLDLGCGTTVHRGVAELAGFKYVGIDYKSEKAPIHADGQALPFKDDSFEFVLSVAVLEHIRLPFVATREANRVLKPGGVFIGTVAFLEPFHGGSFYHHSPLGAYNSLREGGFEIDYIAPNPGWSVLAAQARMALFPRMPRRMAKTLVMPVEIVHRMWWRIGRAASSSASDMTRILKTAGSFTFVAHKTMSA